MSKLQKNKLVAPFVKWVGGKRQLMSEIVELLPNTISRYKHVEPFIGGGSVLFHLQPRNAVINDFNAELINTYLVIKNHPEDLIKDLKKHKNEAEYYYAMREIDRTKNFSNLTFVERASRIIFLNKTCFNGLYRVNNAGEFNVPFGKYKNPNIINEPVIRAVSHYLNTNNIEIFNKDYLEILANTKKNSFVYLDPPYHPISESSNFTGYIKGGFSMEDQIRLREACDLLNSKGIKFLLSNSASNFILEQYKNYDIHIVKARRAINSIAIKRGDVEEVLIRNYE